MSHIRSGFSGVNVPIGSDGSSHNNISGTHSNTINTNVIINKESKKDLSYDVKEISDDVFVVYPPPTTEENPYKERDLKSAQERLEQIKEVQPENEKLIQALSMIIDMLYNNPLYVNKWVVAEMDTLRELIRILTDADDVAITTMDPSCDCGGCCGDKNKIIQTIDSIYVKYGAVVKEFRYCHPAAKQILENCHISLRMVLSSSE